MLVPGCAGYSRSESLSALDGSRNQKPETETSTRKRQINTWAWMSTKIRSCSQWPRAAARARWRLHRAVRRTNGHAQVARGKLAAARRVRGGADRLCDLPPFVTVKVRMRGGGALEPNFLRHPGRQQNTGQRRDAAALVPAVLPLRAVHLGMDRAPPALSVTPSPAITNSLLPQARAHCDGLPLAASSCLIAPPGPAHGRLRSTT